MAESTTTPNPTPAPISTVHPILAEPAAANIRMLRVKEIPAEFPKKWQAHAVNFSGMPGNDDPLASMKHWVLPKFQIQLKQLQHFIS